MAVSSELIIINHQHFGQNINMHSLPNVFILVIYYYFMQI